ncbi:hypothetical protein GGE65_007044 [Skermanella aerolata]|uniref:hypothetical protein n=1 Tax=Skermanella aerolata TaxID=393310 RepID=UPI003D25F157
MTGAAPGMGVPKNAIERRVDRVAKLWNAFAADPDLRLLCWSCDRDERRVIDIFVALESEEAAQTPDAFIRLTSPFEHASSYAPALLEELATQYAQSREGLAEAGVPADWRVPEPVSDEAAGRRLLRAARSFHHCYRDRMDRLVLMLVPDRIDDPAGWLDWLARLAVADVPASVRIMVTDPSEAPMLAERLEQEAAERAVVVAPGLDMPAALDELARSEGEDGPAKQFRIAFVSLGTAAGKGNLKAAQRAAQTALGIARRERWIDQEVVVHMALGGARIGAKALGPAADSYREAILAARRARQARHPVAGKLELVAAMGLGSALVAAATWPEAARVYEAAAPIAAAAKDAVMGLEAWRMAAWCHEQAGNDREAWRCALKALDAGEALPEPMRATSTLPWVGDTLLRLLDRHYRDGDHAAVVRRRLETLLGPEWDRAVRREEPAA